MRKLYASFSGLLTILIERGMDAWQDDSNTYYFFGCTKRGIEDTFNQYDKKNVLDRAKIVSVLEKAEKDGRLCYRHQDSLETESNWLRWVLNVPAKDIEAMCEPGFFTLPAMERYFANVPDVKFIWNHWRSKK